MTKGEDVRANARRRQVSRKVSHDVLVHVRLRNRAERYEDVDVVSIAGRGRRGHDAVCFFKFFCAYFLKGFFRYVFLETSSSSSPKTLPPPLANTTLPRTTHTHTMSPGVGGGGGGGVTLAKNGVVKKLFRELLRARARLFAGDEKALDASLVEIRSHFDSNKNATDEKEIQKRIRDGEEARDFLTMNVLQGKMNERGNFETSLKSADPDKETWEVPKEAK